MNGHEPAVGYRRFQHGGQLQWGVEPGQKLLHLPLRQAGCRRFVVHLLPVWCARRRPATGTPLWLAEIKA